MKKIIKLWKGLVDGFKRLENKIRVLDAQTDGKFSSALIAITCLIALGCFILAFLVFGK
ncbi:MAG: hypothetical protein IJI98_03415 [Methanosphaera sp.]|nr:hypothetical protein [Methanosphaera sp.]